MNRKAEASAANRSAEIDAGREEKALQAAVSALNSDRPHDAALIAHDMLQTAPQNTRALHVLGCAWLMQGRAENAIAPLEQAARGRHDPEIETHLGMALRQSGRRDEALSWLKRASKRRPPHAPAFLEFGAALAAAESYDEAIQTLRRGAEIAPMMPQMAIELGYALLGLKDAASAKTAFARALEILPASADALFGIARAQRQLGDVQAAVDCFRRCLMSNPDDHTARMFLGHCLLELGQLDAGYDCFRTAARSDRKGCGKALDSLAASRRGRFWLKPSAAQRFLVGTKA